MYDVLSENYDRFMNWEARLAGEMPFIEQQLCLLGAGRLRVLDSACGTGMHAIALAKRGYAAFGADLSEEMVAKARRNAAMAGVRVRFETAGFGELSRTFGKASCEGLLCLGNSLPHLLTRQTLAAGLADFAACMRLGGILLIQNRNFDAVMTNRQRWMEPQSHAEGEEEWIFLRFYDFDSDGLLTFHMLVLHREGAGAWSQQVASTRLRPLEQSELLAALDQAGFREIACYGSLAGGAFEAATSSNLVVIARI
ncbi:MAG: class I SAM-dependent methyltransferase [Anaerolineales bacterium]|nr:class I SAM-dependent methyltransferase [Anaerolineales bacterium]